MQCISPITILYSRQSRFASVQKKGIDTGKYNAILKLHPDWTDSQIVEYLYPSQRTVPCGKCAACLSNRRSSWVARLTYELYHSSNGHFITLTFDDDHLIYDIKTKNPVALIDMVSDFVVKLKSKLFRKQKNPLKFFAVSEYGPTTNRPHFHMLLFNLPLNVDLRYLEELWYNGNIKVDHINGARIGYVTKYCLSKIDPDLWCVDDLEYKPQMRCSKKLGAGLLTDPVISHQYKSSLLFDGYVTNGSYRVPVSRYYKDRLLSPMERTIVSDKSLHFAEEHLDKIKSDKSYDLACKMKAKALEYKVNKSIKKSEL